VSGGKQHLTVSDGFHFSKSATTFPFDVQGNSLILAVCKVIAGLRGMPEQIFRNVQLVGLSLSPGASNRISHRRATSPVRLQWAAKSARWGGLTFYTENGIIISVQ
jgi:hypothetical protein